MCSGAETDHQDNGGRKKQGGNANRNTNDEALQLHVREHAVTRVNEEQTQTGLVDVIEASAGVHDGAPGGGYGGRATKSIRTSVGQSASRLADELKSGATINLIRPPSTVLC